MLASTVQFSTNNQPPALTPPPDPGQPRAVRQTNRPCVTKRCPLPQDPTACLRNPSRVSRRSTHPEGRSTSGPATAGSSELVSVPPSSTIQANSRTTRRWAVLPVLAWLWTGLTKRAGQLLLRKEVIQPHLPVRLPCYDFVPIADPAFDGSLPQGVGPPASGVTDFRDVTGGVYKARERIHRSVADLRLLATPTSWGRVADPNPN